MQAVTTGICAYISSIFNSLTKSEKKIGEYVLKEPEKIIYTSITDLANEIQVGEATIMRFCRKLGYQSYQIFKLSLGQDIANSTNSQLKELDVEIKEDDSLEAIIEKTLNINICALHETLWMLNTEEVKKAIAMIFNARKVLFCGAGVSEVTAKDAAYRFMRIGIAAINEENHHFQRMQASLLSEDDVVVGISYSGSTKDVCDILNIAKDMGAKTICITHNDKSPITKISDVVLLHGSKQNLLQGGALSTKMCQLMVIDILYNGVFKEMGAKAANNKNLTLKAILERFI